LLLTLNKVMALTHNSDDLFLFVAKRTTGTTQPYLYVPTAEDLNKFNYQDAKVVGVYDSGALKWSIAFIDMKSYLP